MKYLHVALYKFAPLTDHSSVMAERRSALKELCRSLELKGTIMLSPEGLNCYVAGLPERVEELLAALRRFISFDESDLKRHRCEAQPYQRMLVKLKKEIISMGVPGIDPARDTGARLSAKELKRWLDEGRDVVLLDTRNEYEIERGTFRGARRLGLRHFRQFPRKLREVSPELAAWPVVMFCTGGIRCEKATALAKLEGLRDVYQLDGGILRYFEECGGAHYEGDCFVFDERVTVKPA